MKELTIEEKANRYDEAIKVAKGNYETIMQMDNNCTFAKEVIVNSFHSMFPELKDEDKDERLKTILIRFIKGYKIQQIEEFTDKQIIDWIKKQGKQKSATWNEEDDKASQRIIAQLTEDAEYKSYIDNSLIQKDIDWLLLLKNRINNK